MKIAVPLLLLAGLVVAGEPTTTDSGLRYEVISPGEGERPSKGDIVLVHYVGKLANGREFDSSRKRGKPFRFILGYGNVIKGWDEGVALMNRGATYRFVIPPDLAYGKEGFRGVIPPDAELTFEVELVDFEPGPRFTKLDPEKTRTTASGLEYQVIEEGEGEPARGDLDGVKMSFVLWTGDGEILTCTQTTDRFIEGVVKGVSLGRMDLPFLKEAAKLMPPGARYRFRVPAELGFGGRRISPRLEPGAPSQWTLEMVEVHRTPEFQAPVVESQETTASGLKYEVLKEGEGASPGPSDRVTVHYAGWLQDGTGFDASYGRGEPAKFPLDGFIKGWTEGLQLMKVGAVYRFEIPAALAYGATPPAGSTIPPDATLIFLVELLSID